MTPLSPAGLEAIGQALFGQHWATDLALRLNVADRTIRRFVAGTRPIPDWLAPELRQLAKDRPAEIKTAIAKHLPAESR